MKTKWSILITTVSHRNDQFELLVNKVLLPQVEKYKDVEILAYWDNFEEKLGVVRNKLINEAKGKYVSFIDDDDKVPTYYCKEIHPLLDGVDYIGWRMQLYEKGVKQKPTFHSLRYEKWDEDDKGWYRNTSHLNPIKRSIALKGDFEHSVPEDVSWAEQVRPHTKTEHYIDRCMYYYIHDKELTYWDKKTLPVMHAYRPVIEHPNFRWHPDSREQSHYKGTIKMEGYRLR